MSRARLSSKLAPTSGTPSPLALYSAGLAASFGISHIDAVHRTLSRLAPRAYPYLIVVLPVGRCVFGLLIVEERCRKS